MVMDYHQDIIQKTSYLEMKGWVERKENYFSGQEKPLLQNWLNHFCDCRNIYGPVVMHDFPLIVWILSVYFRTIPLIGLASCFGDQVKG